MRALTGVPAQGTESDPEEASGRAGGGGAGHLPKPELQHKSINRYLSIAGQSCLELV